MFNHVTELSSTPDLVTHLPVLPLGSRQKLVGDAGICKGLLAVSQSLDHPFVHLCGHQMVPLWQAH